MKNRAFESVQASQHVQTVTGDEDPEVVHATEANEDFKDDASFEEVPL